MAARISPAALAKYLAIVIVYFAVDMLSGMLFPVGLDWSPPPDQLPWVFGGMLLTAAVNSLVISLLIVSSGGRGWRLFGAVALAWYGTMTFLAQVEAYWFGPALGLPGSVPIALALKEIPLVLIVTLTAMLLWGRARLAPAMPDSGGRLPASYAEWAWKLALAAVVYLALYFGFGFVVAWQNPALRAMYDNGADPTVFNMAYLIPLQVARSLLWVLLALPLIRMARGPLWQVAVLVGLLYALPMNIGHAIPNPIMPDASVRLSHFIETASSNFLFGLFVTWLLSWRAAGAPVGSARPARRLSEEQIR